MTSRRHGRYTKKGHMRGFNKRFVANRALRRRLGAVGLFLSIAILLGSGRDLGPLFAAEAAASAAEHAIRAVRHLDGQNIIYSFSITEDFRSFGHAWDFGDGGTSTTATPVWVYSGPGTYEISARIRTAAGAWLDLTPREIAVEYEIPGSPSRRSYVTVDEPGQLVAFAFDPESVNGGKVPRSFSFLGESNGRHVYRLDEPGFFRLDSQSDSCYVFVSPTASVHTDRNDVDWYKTQFNTGTTSNCGPTVAAMAVTWATGGDVRVYDVRQYVGWTGIGAVSIGELQNFLTTQGVTSYAIRVNDPREIMDMIDEDHLVGVVYDMAGLDEIQTPETDLFGQYYTDHGGHYLAIKGYTIDREYFIVYDPIPSDWAYNSARYADGASMLGRNRYYPVDQLFAALRNRHVLEVHR